MMNFITRENIEAESPSFFVLPNVVLGNLILQLYDFN